MEYLLIQRIIELSVADTWEEAKQEWTYLYLTHLENEYGKCLCSHYPIVNLCHIQNKINGSKAIVGNCCINKFLDNIVDAKKLSERLTKGKINKYCIQEAHAKNIINDWEHGFIMDTLRKRKLSTKQKFYKESITKKIVDGLIK